jgi:putative nucleotidyltransferase with HDIG domain
MRMGARWWSRGERARPARTAGAALVGAALTAAAWGLDVARRERRNRDLHRRLVELLLNALTAGDPVTARHSRRVADLSYALARAIRMPRRSLRTLRVAALLHDMGKIDDRFFHIVHSRKPLSDDERARIEHHPHESAHILAPLEPVHHGLREIVCSHHEAWDGRGYPQGLRGAEIPLGARIIALADAFDAMTQPRKYRSALTVPDALGELRESAGSQFDPELVETIHGAPVISAWTDIAGRGLFSEEEANGEHDSGSTVDEGRRAG